MRPRIASRLSGVISQITPFSLISEDSNQQTLRLICPLTSVATILLLSLATAFGQNQQRGFQPGASYAISNVEAINADNGNMAVRVPLAALPPGRGGIPGFQLNLVYNSKLYETHTEEIPEPGTGEVVTQVWLNPSEQGGWHYSFGSSYDLKLVSRTNLEGQYPCVCGADYQKNAYIYRLMVVFPDGGEHEFRPLGYSDLSTFNDGYYNIDPNGVAVDASCGSLGNDPPSYSCNIGSHQATSGGMTYYSTDGTYARLFIPYAANGGWNNNWTLSFSDGRRLVNVNGARTMFDRNNNVVVTGLQDEQGRHITFQTNAATQEDHIFVTGANEEQLEWIVKWKTVYVSRPYYATVATSGHERGNRYVQTLMNEERVVDRITLPAQAGALTYIFGYSASASDPSPGISPGWGELNAITLPTGAQVDYTWAFDGNGDNVLGQPPKWDWVLTNRPVRKDLTYLLQFDGTAIPTTETWTYSRPTPQGGGSFTMTNPDEGVTTTYSYAPSTNSPFVHLAYRTDHPDGSVTERTWAQNRPPGIPLIPAAVNPYIKTELTAIRNAGGTLVKAAIKEYNYDKNGNVTRVDEYDWIDYGDVQRDSQGNPKPPSEWQGFDLTPFRRKTTSNSYYNPTPDASDSTTSNGNIYCYLSAPLLRTAIKDTEVSLGAQKFARAEFFYDNQATTGNLIEQKSWDSSKGAYSSPLASGNSIAVSTQYNQYGMPTLTTDARGYQTQITYGSVGGVSDLYPTQVKNAYGTSVQRTTTSEYDFTTGLITRVTDADNNVSTATTYDAIGRPTLVKAAEGKPEEAHTTILYSDSDRRVITKADMTALGDGKLVSIQHYDQLGRSRLSRQLEDSVNQSPTDESVGIKVQTRYKFSATKSYQVTSHPYREAYSWQASGAMDWTRSKADNGGRLMEIEKFGGATLPAPWGSNSGGSGQVVTTYDANFTTVTDQAGKVRRSMTNALGQLVRVDEPVEDPNHPSGYLGSTETPAQPTYYAYDALGNLRTVTQGTTVTQGSQQRFFAYDSMSRLLRARNPEQDVNAALPSLTDPFSGNNQWSMAYTYDNNGNLATRIDARNITTTYAYDPLNRNTSVVHTNDPANTPTVTRVYDGATNGKGKLWKSQTQYGSLTTIDSYDSLGRPQLQRQQFYSADASNWSASFAVQRTYSLAGQVVSQTYPSGHTVTYTYDTAGRLASFTGNLGDGELHTYASSFQYDAAGRQQQEQYGTQTPLFHKQHYNTRGQLYDVRLSTQSWAANEQDGDRGALVNYYSAQNYTPGYVGTDNNGNLTRSEHYIPGSGYFQESYEYDTLNRLTSVAEKQNGQSATFTQAYTYDRFGNRTINTAATWGDGINKVASTINPANNRFTTFGDSGDSDDSDSAGGGSPTGSTTVAYDSNGNLISGGGTFSASFVPTYDAENRMSQVDEIGGYSPIRYVYDADGHRVQRLTGESVWQVYGMDGELLAEFHAGFRPRFGYDPGQPGGTTFIPEKEYGYRSGQLLVTAKSGDDKRVDRYITNFYFAALGRGPSSTELDQQRAVLLQAGSQSETQFFAAIQTLGQQLFDVSNPGGAYNARQRTDTQFVTDLYYAYLQRSPDSGGLAFYVWQLSPEGGLSRSAVRDGFASTGNVETVSLVSVVYGINNGNLVDRVTHYLGNIYLGAPAGSGNSNTDLATLETAAADGQSQVILAARTIGINFFQQYLSGSSTNQEFVTALFQSFLQREPSSTELSTWVSTVQSQGRSQTLQSFVTLPACEQLAGTLYREILWLTADQLGTPRMISERSGSVAGIKRHDYLPFGEDVPAALRNGVAGYAASDSVRQKFTLKERDAETGLDYFGARYFSSIQGRFTTIDPLLESAEPTMPQSWNRYSYVLNNPLALTDPNGEIWVKSGSGNIVWFSQERWDCEISTLKDSNGNAVYTPLSSSEMEFNTNYGRVRLNPDGPDADAAPGSDAYLGFSIIGDNKTNYSAAMALGLTIGARGKNVYFMLGLTTIATVWILTSPVNQQLPLVDNNFYSQSKHNKEVIEGLIGTAVDHIAKIRNHPSSRDVSHWKGEVKAALDRAKNIAERLAGKTKEAIKEKIKDLEEQANSQ